VLIGFHIIVTIFILLEIDRKEARINAMRCAILETFPEPNRRLLQRFSLSLSLPKVLENTSQVLPSFCETYVLVFILPLQNFEDDAHNCFSF
jgi:hypothetical protein